jgi:trans-aconitate methyltransferase
MFDEQKPTHLGPEYAAQFCDASVAAAYRHRPPYPSEVFDTLVSLLTDPAGHVLELGAGTGDIALGLAGQVEHIDAVEPSAAMRAVAEKLAPANLRWIASSAEEFRAHRPYALAVAAESLHWMDWGLVMPRIASWLAPGAVLAIVAARTLNDLPWQGPLRKIVARYSTNRAYAPYDIVEEIARRRLVTELGRKEIVSRTPFSQPIDAYVESFHSRNGFSRDRMSEDAAAAFDREVRELVRSHAGDGRVISAIRVTVAWGRPG